MKKMMMAIGEKQMEAITIDTNEVEILENLDFGHPKSELVEGGIGKDEIICAIRGETAKRLLAAFDVWPIHWPPKE
jgi:hypothetical protein